MAPILDASLIPSRGALSLMSPRARRIAAVVTAAALVGGGGVAAATAATGNAATASKQQVPDGAGSGPGRGAPGHGPGGLPSDALASIAKTLGVTTEQLQAALDAARPTGQPDRGRADLAAELAGALNADAAKIQSILEANRPTAPSGDRGDRRDGPGPGPGDRPGGGRPGPDHGALVAALAKGLGLDEATVKAALDKLAASHEAEHAARETALYAAIAKSLGVDASAVQQAFEAVCPRPPARPNAGR
jgi:hypothetical protein